MKLHRLPSTYNCSTDTLREILRSLLDNSVQQDEVVTQTIYTKNLDIYDIVEYIDIFPKVIFHPRNSSKTFFAFGCSQIFSSIQEAVSVEIQIPKWTVLGFDPENDGWENFPNRKHWMAELTCVVEEDADGSQQIEILYTAKQCFSTQDSNHYPVYQFHHNPNQEEWIQNIIDSKQLYQNNTIEKIVLARCSRRIIQKQHHRILQDISKNQKNCYHFFYSPKSECSFFGVSPERLFCITNNTLYTEALAGTRPRESDVTKDTEQAQDLLQHPKDREEHNIVVEYLQNTLSRFASSIEITNKEVLQLPYVQHIRTNISATLYEKVDIDDLLNTLHPTPAVCGMPKDTAYSLLRDIEQIPRGWYAGSFGLLENTTIDCTVMIRSSLCIHDKMYVWTGAGIVESSDPRTEWEELNNKAKQFFQISAEPSPTEDI